LEPFQLAEDAILDIDAIWLYLLEREGLETADRIVTEVFKSFYKLADVPNSGHRRADLTSKKVFSTESSPTSSSMNP
jgi:plasmid stabilization system protein ParE